MKNKIAALVLLSSFCMPNTILAQELNLPTIIKPSVLEEGTERILTQSQVDELLPWAKNSKNFLEDLVENVQAFPMADKVERLLDGIRSVVSDSGSKNSELFMRYILNRSLVINEILSTEIEADAVGSNDIKARSLILSINMAIKFYEKDLEKLQNSKVVSPYASFGKEYFSFLKELNKSVFDASAQYNLERISLEWLQWDLYRDLNNTAYASQIVKINNSLKIFPTTKLKDSQYINYVRQIRKISEGLNIVIKEIRVEEPKVQLFTKQELEEEKPAIVSGSRVVDNRDIAGTVHSVFENGAVKIKFDIDGYGALENSHVNNLSPSVNCYKKSGICVGDNIIDSKGYSGNILYIFENGVVRAKFDGYGALEKRKMSELSKEVDCIQNFCRNNRIIDSSGYVGTIKRVYSSGQVKAVFDGYGALESRHISNLSKQK